MKADGKLLAAASALLTALVIGACGGGGSSGASSNSTSSVDGAPASTTIPQPPVSQLNKRTRSRLAPESRRVDLVAPSFSNPTEITNPLFPISDLSSALLLGKLHGKPWRAETTLLPDTKTVEWNGQQIEALQSQFVAYLEGRIFEVAVDLYAQDDDGSVWYLGEDAFTYEHGRVSDTEGTWVAGITGPPALIMPAHPRVGDVYRTENIPGLVFEQVTVKKVGVTVNGPTGRVPGAMVGQELHLDERRLEDKTFAPGYGEFFSGGGGTFEATALAVPADLASGPPPPELEALSTGADDLFSAVRTRNWHAASGTIDQMRSALGALRADSPQRLYAQMNDALDSVRAAVRARRGRRGSLASLDVSQASLDFELRYLPTVEVSRSRFDLWARQLQVDAAAGDSGAVSGDVATLNWIRDRIPLERADGALIDDQLRFLDAAAEAKQLAAAADAAPRLRQTLAQAQPAQQAG